MENKDSNTSAFFVQRLFAYLIDMFLITVVATIVTYPFTDLDAINKFSKESNEIMSSYQNGDIDMITYFNQSMDLNYEQSKINGFASIIQILLLVLYFIVYQIYHNGQTIGKKLLKIRNIQVDNKELTMNNMIIRELFNHLILLNILVSILLLFNKNIYMYGTMLLEGIQYFFLLVTVFMIFIRKDGRGLADFIGKTKVVRTNIYGSEVELCQN